MAVIHPAGNAALGQVVSQMGMSTCPLARCPWRMEARLDCRMPGGRQLVYPASSAKAGGGLKVPANGALRTCPKMGQFSIITYFQWLDPLLTV